MSYPQPTAPYTYGAYSPYPYQTTSGYQTWPYTYPYVPAPVQPTTRAPAPIVPQSAKPTATTSSAVSTSAKETVAAASSAGASTRSQRKQPTIKGIFTKELKNLMYGFGDDRNPASDTVNVMEEILVEYIVDVCQVAVGPTKRGRLSIEDLRKALSRPADAKKLARMEELLFMQEDIKRARAQFEESDTKGF